MGLLHDIQAELLDGKAPIGPILLKLRYLAAQLGSGVLEEWVKYETEGYPEDVEVPEYRQAALTYRGTFTDGFRTISNVSVPEFIIEKEAGPSWLKFSIRDSVSVIDSLVATERSDREGKFGVPAGNLIPFLHKKVYPGMGAIELSSTFAGAPFEQIHNMVRAKILDLTLELEKRVPVAALIALGKTSEQRPETGAQATTIAQTIIYGNQTNVSNTAPGGTIHTNVVAGDQISLVQYLIEKGVPADDAQELAQIAAEEGPESPGQPLGARAKKWLGKAAGTVWDVSKEAGTQLLAEGLKSYYGLGA